MVTYLPQQASRTITVLSAEVGTTLTIDAPAEVIQGISFEIFGVLRRVDTNAPLPDETIEFWQDGLYISSMLTALDGTYLFTHSIVDTGSHTLSVRFTGSVRPGLALSPSSAFRGIGLVEPSMLPLLALLGIAAYVVLKKK